jgi:hypothetical protein
MSGRVIQGWFLSGQPKLMALVQPRKTAPIWLQKKAATRPPGPPVPAFARQSAAVQRHGGGDAFAVEAGPLGLASGGGKPLPETVRRKMEAAFGADFSNVRVHIGPQAERIGALAFTVGGDIYFAPGRYQPETLRGQQLLGHELAHVVQQRAGRVRNPRSTGLAVVQDHALEAEGGPSWSARIYLSVAVKQHPEVHSQEFPSNELARSGLQRSENQRTSIGGVVLRQAQSDTAELCNLRVVEPYRRQHFRAGACAQSDGNRALERSALTRSGCSPRILVKQCERTCVDGPETRFRRPGLSAVANAVMPRAVLSLPDTSPLRRHTGGVVQCMDVGTGKDRSKRIKELMNDQVAEDTISRDLKSVFRKVKNWAI